MYAENCKIVTVRPAPYEFLEGAQRYQYHRVGKHYVMYPGEYVP